MKYAKVIKIFLVVLFVGALLYLRATNYDADTERKNSELVQSVMANNHNYELFFHRSAQSYNIIRKDGVVVFDGRQTRRCAGASKSWW